LNAINVTISGEQSIVLDETDFTTTGTSPYTYTTTYQANSDRTYTATLNTADDFADNDGASGQSESVTVDTIAPTISDFSVTNPSSQNVSVAFNATEQLSTITVSISGAESTILDGRNFAETGSGPYNYTAVYEGDSDGIYTATLNTANDSVDNDGASDQSESVTVDTTPPTISEFAVTNPSSQNISVSFNSTEQLGTITVSITGAESATLNETSFTQVGSGPYNYTAIYEGNSDDAYTATLNAATDSVGNDGASDQSESVTVDTTPQQSRSSQSRILGPERLGGVQLDRTVGYNICLDQR